MPSSRLAESRWLTERERQVILAWYGTEDKPEAIGERLGLTPAAVLGVRDEALRQLAVRGVCSEFHYEERRLETERLTKEREATEQRNQIFFDELMKLPVDVRKARYPGLPWGRGRGRAARKVVR